MLRGVGEVGACGHSGECEQVLGLALVEVEATVDAVVEETEVDTNVPCVCLLPLDVGVVAVGLEHIDECVVRAILAAERLGYGVGI